MRPIRPIRPSRPWRLVILFAVVEAISTLVIGLPTYAGTHEWSGAVFGALFPIMVVALVLLMYALVALFFWCVE